MDTQKTKKVIILGTSHFNTIGLVQSLGNAGLHVVGVFTKCDLLYKSVFIKEIHLVPDYQAGIEFIADKLVENHKNVIIPGGDEAALLLEKNKDLLNEHFLFQHCKGDVTIAMAMNKNFQCKIAEQVGFDVPKSFDVEKNGKIPENIPIPCIIKPLMSCIGDKDDITVANNKTEAINVITNLLESTEKLIVQEFIERNDRELNILGVGLTNGECIIPLSIKKERIHPKGRGSVTVGKVEPLKPELNHIVDCIKRFIKTIGYVGLFSIELMCDDKNNKIYFIEANLRNDALNPFIVRGGVNLPLLHYQDLVGELLYKYKPTNKSFKIINEAGHISQVYRGTINIFEWLWDVISIHRFAMYYKQDWRLFIQQFIDKLKR